MDFVIVIGMQTEKEKQEFATSYVLYIIEEYYYINFLNIDVKYKIIERKRKKKTEEHKKLILF